MFVEFRFEGRIEMFAPELHWPAARRTGAIFQSDDFQWGASTILYFSFALDDQHTVGFIRDSFISQQGG
jgi:hypothetical protein